MTRQPREMAHISEQNLHNEPYTRTRAVYKNFIHV